MTRQRTYFTNTILIATCLTLGCTSSGVLGCGSSGGGEEAPTIDSDVPAVYQITSYQGNENGCDQVADVPLAPSHVVFYAFRPNSAPNDTRLGGAFCSGVEECRALAEFAGEPSSGYSFLVGDDETGWTGWGILDSGPSNDQCQAEVQTHMLSVGSAGAIQIETKTMETVFAGMGEGNDLTCRNADAIASLNDDLPCKAILLLEATREAEL
jgi:hypothetical protein